MTCPACGNGAAVALGMLGPREWFRCRACGWEYSRERTRRRIMATLTDEQRKRVIAAAKRKAREEDRRIVVWAVHVKQLGTRFVSRYFGVVPENALRRVALVMPNGDVIEQ